MIIHVKQTFEITNQYGETYRARNNDIDTPPEWVAHHPFFRALCDSGKITVHVASKDLEDHQTNEEVATKEKSSKKK